MKTSHIKVYKTTVTVKNEALIITESIREKLPDADVSFDLEDCDRVLRVETIKNKVDDNQIDNILSSLGHQAEPLPV